MRKKLRMLEYRLIVISCKAADIKNAVIKWLKLHKAYRQIKKIYLG